MLKLPAGYLCLLSLCGLPVAGAALATGYTPLQPMVDAIEPGAVLVPEPGIYAGPVTVDKPITIDGEGRVTIDAGGSGSVVYLKTDGATLKGLHLTHSGNSHNDIDAGVQVRGSFNVIKDNRIDDCLFGVDLQQSEHNLVRRNRISSKPAALGLRGDAIRLWYSFHNEVTDNVVRNSRDTVVWYSRDNLIARNDARGGRYSLHFMYSQHNQVEQNHYENNTVGIFLMYSDGVVVKDNYIARANGPTGIGIGFKETSNVTIEGNKILYNAVGLYLDVSPYQPDTTNRLSRNLVAYNGIAVRFLNDWQGNVFKSNRFKGNITEVAVSGGQSASRNDWDGNYWDRYQGFDRNGDGIGDRPYELYGYADRIWMDVPAAQFFKGSPMLEVLDFLERLAPFSRPSLLLRDQRPVLTAAAISGERSVPVDTGRPGVADRARGEAAFDQPPEPSAYELLRRSLDQP